LKNTQNTKLALQNVTGQGQGTIENAYKASKARGQKNYSSKFRESLFKQRSHLAEHALFNQTQAIKDLQNKMPQPLTDDHHAVSGGDGAKQDRRGNDAANQVEKMFRAVERKLQMPNFTGIVEESLKCQVFGVFGQNYKRYTTQHSQSDDKYKDKFMNYFNDSEIFGEMPPVYRALLYFNLPYEPIISEMWKPQLMFTYRQEDPDSEKKELSQIIEEFEVAHDARQDQGRTKRSGDAAPNIILMKVASVDQSDSNKTYIIGGYASHKWKGQAHGGNGDKSCFLFNLTQNLRFNARGDKQFYQSSDGQYLKFGSTDLKISDGFQQVSSEIVPPSNDGAVGGDRRALGADDHQNSNGSHFSFGNDLTQTNQVVTSIIPGKKQFSPNKVEVYQLVPNVFHKQ